MRRCLSCHNCFEMDSWTCPSCGWAPENTGNIPVFDPVLAGETTPFNAEVFRNLAAAEQSHFWFIARRRLIRDMVRHHFPGVNRVLEIGCGTGQLVGGFSQDQPGGTYWGSDASLDGLGHAAETWSPKVRFLQANAMDLPFRSEFQLVGAFDVIEHIADDKEVMRQVWHSLCPGGGIILTVPQHNWLWSPVDEAAGHYRRYTATMLSDLLQNAGFKIVRSTSFVSLLLPLMMMSRLARPGKPPRIEDEFAISPAVNRICSALMTIEGAMIRSGLNLPAGGSRLVIARRD